MICKPTDAPNRLLLWLFREAKQEQAKWQRCTRASGVSTERLGRQTANSGQTYFKADSQLERKARKESGGGVERESIKRSNHQVAHLGPPAYGWHDWDQSGCRVRVNC